MAGGRNNNPGGRKPAPERSPSPRPPSPRPPQPSTESTAPLTGSPRPTIFTTVRQANVGSVRFGTWAQMMQQPMQGQGRGTGGTGGGQLPPATRPTTTSTTTSTTQPESLREGPWTQVQRGRPRGAPPWQPTFPAGVQPSDASPITTTDNRNRPLRQVPHTRTYPPIGPIAHNRAIYGVDNGRPLDPSGGHVWTGDVAPRRPARLDPRYRNGQHANWVPDAQHYWQNGVYRQPGPRIEVVRDGQLTSIPKPEIHTMFPRGLTPAQVEGLANVAWNRGNPFYGINRETGQWHGFARLPNGQTIHITGHVDADNKVYHYHPDSGQ